MKTIYNIKDVEKPKLLFLLRIRSLSLKDKYFNFDKKKWEFIDKLDFLKKQLIPIDKNIFK